MKRLILLTLVLILLIGCAPKPRVEVAPIIAPQQTIVQPSTTEKEPAKVEEQVKEITVVAKKFSFNPNPIIVNKGDKVKLILRSEDVEHGFAIPEYGINKKMSPDNPSIAEFTADKAGEFEIRCSVFCGSGHSDMRGKLIVN